MTEVTWSITEDGARSLLLQAKEVYRERGEHTPVNKGDPSPGMVCIITALDEFEHRAPEDDYAAYMALSRSCMDTYGVGPVKLNAECDDETALGLFDLALQYLNA